MDRKKGLLPVAYILLALAAESLYHEADPAQKGILLLALHAFAALGALAVARDTGRAASFVHFASAALAAASAALLVSLLFHAEGLFGGTLPPLSAALLSLAAYERLRPGPVQKALLTLLALILPLSHPAAGWPAFALALAPPALPLALSRIAAPGRRAAALLAAPLLATLLAPSSLSAFNRRAAEPLFRGESEGFLVVFDPVSGAAAYPRLPELEAARVGTAEVGAARTFRFGLVGLLPGRRFLEPDALPGAVDLAEVAEGVERPAFLADCLRLMPGRDGLPFGPRDRLSLTLVRGALAAPYLLHPPEKTGERFAFPVRLLAAAPARAFLRGDSDRLYLLEESGAADAVERTLTVTDAAGRMVTRVPLPFEPSGMAYAAGPCLFGRSFDPATGTETHLVEFRDRSGTVTAGFLLPSRVQFLAPLPGGAAAVAFHGRSLSLLSRDGTLLAAAERADAGPVTAGATADRLHLIDYLTRRLEIYTLPGLAPLPAEAPEADLLAVSGGSLLLADQGGNTLFLRRAGDADFVPLPEPRKGIRFLAPAVGGGFLVGHEGGIDRLDETGQETGRADLRPLCAPEPCGDGYACADATGIDLLAPDLSPRGRLPGIRVAGNP